MLRGVEHLISHRAAGLPLKPGGRKTSITLCAFETLRQEGTVRSMLVIAPLRVCRQVWRQEAAKWSQFRHLKFALLHGPKKDELLRQGDADIYLINPEGVAWLAKQYFGRPLPFDIVTVDELTKFKNHQSERSKALRPRTDRTPWIWGLTGSLAPNGYMDVFGQQLILDHGAALGRYITHFRDQHFQIGYDGFTYDLMPGADKRITARLAPYWMAVDERDYAQLPAQVDNPIMLDLDKASQATYDKMKRDMLAELPEGIVTAANKAACYSKLSQMANGAVYVGDHKAAVSLLHDIKLDAIEELVEELSGEPLLIAYEFNHDLDRLRERFGTLDPATERKVLPYLGKGTTAAQEDKWIAQWNRGELPLLAAHPASAGHGLNMQEANARNVAWFGITWDFELYDQFIRRIRRSGNESAQVFNHLLIVRGTIDELKLAALGDKDMTQERLLAALNKAISRETADAQGAGFIALDDRRLPMVARLSTQPGPAAANNPAPAAAESVKPRGWGAPPPAGGAHNGTSNGAGAPEQRERIQQTIAPPTQHAAGSPQEQARDAFTGAVHDAQDQVRNTDYGATAGPAPTHEPTPPVAEPARRTRSRSAAPEAVGGAVASGGVPPVDPSQAIENAAIITARATVMQGVIISDPNATVSDIIETTRELMDFVLRG